MRKWVKWTLVGCGGAIVAITGVGILTHSIGFNAGSCLTDAEIQDSVRTAFDDRALRFVDTVMNSHTDAAYAEMTATAQKNQTPEEFRSAVQAIRSAMTGLSGIRVLSTYYLQGVATGANGAALCTLVARGSVKKLEDRVTLALAPVPEQAHVIIEGRAKSHTWTLALWLIPAEGATKIQGFWAQQTTMADKSAFDLLNIARSQHSRGHIFNAAILYAGSKQLAIRGPNVRLGVTQEIDQEVGALDLPNEIQGKPPFHWQFGTDRYQVVALAPADLDGKLAILIRHEVPTIADDEDARTTNQRLIKDFEAAHPDLAEAFEAVLIELIDQKTARHFLLSEDLQKGT